MAPTLALSDLQTAISAGTLTSTSFTPTAGDVLVVKTGTWWNAISPGTPTDTSGQTWTSRVQETGAPNNGWVEIWTAVVTGSPGAITVSITPASNSHHTLLVERWTGAQLAATPATGHALASGSGVASATLTTTANGSAVSWCLYDGSSADPATRTYQASATEESLSDQHSGSNGVFYFASQAAATAGSQTFGLATPDTFYAMAGIEIQTAGAVGSSAPPARPIVVSGAVQRATL
jgi:hypothetical protein